MKTFDFDYKKNFNNGKEIFAELHFDNGKEKEALARLAEAPSSLGFSIDRYAFILHDSDTDENGVAKVPHIHLLFVAKESHSKTYWIDTLYNAFSDLVRSRDAVGVTATQYERGALRYLVHRDHKLKYQYDPEKVVSSPADWFADALVEQPVKNPSLGVLLACENHAEIYDLVGLTQYDKACRAYDDLRREQFKRDHYQALLDAYMEAIDAFRLLALEIEPLRRQTFELKTNWSIVISVVDKIDELRNKILAKYESLKED